MPRLTSQQKKTKLNEILAHLRLTYYRYKKYPTYDSIEEKFHTNLRTYNLNIKKLYRLASISYKRDPNPFLRYRKERKLAEITEKLLIKFCYKIKRVSIGPSGAKGADIIVEDNHRRLIPVEIKAYQKFGKLGQDKHSSYRRNEILQLKRYIKNLHSPYGYLVTSTDRKTFKTIPSSIRVLFGEDLRKLLVQFKMYKELKTLEWIRNSSISYKKEEMYKKIHDQILTFVKKGIDRRRYISSDEIMRKFKVHVESYFPGGMRELYKEFNIDVETIPNYRMSRNFDKEKFKRRIIDFVKSENKEKGKIPTYKEIQREFRCLPKIYFRGGIREMARLAGIKYSRKFATKTPEERKLMRYKIIQYVKRKLRKGYYPGHRDLQKELFVAPLNYFDSIEEIYQKAGHEGYVKRTWKNSNHSTFLKS